MDLAGIERLVEMVQAADVRELTLRQAGTRITIKRCAYTVAPSTPCVTVELDGNAAPAEPAPIVGAPAVAGSVRAEPSTVPITAPLVGVYHHVKPVIGLGTRVTKGHIVGTIEAMGLSTEVVAPADGVIADAPIQDGRPVEFGQLLFALQPEVEG